MKQRQPHQIPEIETDFIGENLQYPGIIMRQIDRIGLLSTIMGRVDNSSTSFLQAISLLQCQLDPYGDAQYEEERKEINNWSNEFYEKNIKNRSPLTIFNNTPPMNTKKAMLLFSVLMGLVARRGLGLETDISGEVGGSQ